MAFRTFENKPGVAFDANKTRVIFAEDINEIQSRVVALEEAGPGGGAPADGSVVAIDYAGADIGAKINAAYADLPAGGGTIIIPTGSYSFSTSIVIGTLNKPALLKSTPGGSTQLIYTGAGTALTINVTQGHVESYGVDGITLVGPSSAGSTIGIYIGGTNGAEGIVLQNFKVTGFGQGLVIGPNTWVSTVLNAFFYDNNQHVSFDTENNAGEMLRFVNTDFADSATYANGVSITGAASVVFSMCSFDDCGVYIGDATNIALFDGCHFENPVSNTTYAYLVIDVGTDVHVTCVGTIFGITDSTTLPTALIENSASLTLVGCTVTGWNSDPVGYLVHNADSDSHLEVYALKNCNNSFTTLSYGETEPYVAGVSDVAIPAGGATGELLAKASGDDGDVEWFDAPGSLPYVVSHGSTASTSRPTWAGVVMWIGSVEPTNAEDGDVWIDNS